MNVQRLLLLATSGVVISGCGAVTTASVGSTVHDITTVADRGTAVAPAQSLPASTAAPAATPVTPPAAQVVVVTVDDDSSGATVAVRLVTTAGTVLASSRIPGSARWTVGAGSGAAYWVSGGTLQSLDSHGTVTTLATVPDTESGRVVVSPSGAQWAYATMSTTAGVITNRLYRGGPGAAAQLVAERIADPAHPAPDAPPSWQYYLESWNASGILVERQPLGGCGCGTPFDMQMSAGYSALIDPVSGAATTVTASTDCPLSGLGADGTAACFHVSSTGASDGIDFRSTTHAVAHYALSGKNLGGDMVLGALTAAYATVPADAGGCGGPDWHAQTTLHLMTIATGDARTVGGNGLSPAAWLRDGQILATLTVAGPATGQSTGSLVTVDPSTGRVTTLLDQSAVVVGVA